MHYSVLPLQSSFVIVPDALEIYFSDNSLRHSHIDKMEKAEFFIDKPAIKAVEELPVMLWSLFLFPKEGRCVFYSLL